MDENRTGLGAAPEAPADSAGTSNIEETGRQARDLAVEAERLAAERKALEAEKAAHAAEMAEARAAKFELAVFNLAREMSVDAGALKETGITDLETLKRVAALLPKKTGITPDSGKTTGGEDLSKLSPGEKIARGVRNLKG